MNSIVIRTDQHILTKCLSHPSILKIIKIVGRNPGINKSQIERLSSISNQTVGHHLKTLVNINIVEEVKSTPIQIRYSLRKDNYNDCLSWFKDCPIKSKESST